MNYAALVQLYFERSTAMQGYWTVYIFVIGAVLGFSTFRQRPELATTILVTVLYCCFAYKNIGAIEATAAEQQAIRSAIVAFPDLAPGASDYNRTRKDLEPVMPAYDALGARYFHLVCDLLTIAVVWVKEWRRRHPEVSPVDRVK
jgi:hypothetical protein